MVAVGKSSTIVPGEGTMYASEATTGVPGSRSAEMFDGLTLTEVRASSSSSEMSGWSRRRGDFLSCIPEVCSSSSAPLSSLSSTSIGGAEIRIGVDGPADSSLIALEFSASLCLAFRCQPSASPSVSVAESRSVQSPSPSPRELAKLKLLDPSTSCLPSCSIAFCTSVIVACITSPSVVRGVESPRGSGFGEPVGPASDTSRSVCRTIGDCGSGSGI